MTNIPKWTMDQMNLHDFGNTIQVSGVIYSDREVNYICMMPKEAFDERVPRVLELPREDWDKILRQTDLVETEILQKAEDGKLVKAFIRKSTRSISQHVSWAVFRRDTFRCQYCGADDVPLTVDHLVLWEEGGPSTEENLLTCCKKCNNARGNMQYADWLEDKYYKRVSKGLGSGVRLANEALADTLADIPRLVHQRKKR